MVWLGSSLLYAPHDTHCAQESQQATPLWKAMLGWYCASTSAALLTQTARRQLNLQQQQQQPPTHSTHHFAQLVAHSWIGHLAMLGEAQ